MIEPTCGDMLELDWWTGTDIVFAHCTCFDDAMMRAVAARAGALREGALFITVSLALVLQLFDLVRRSECRTRATGACSVMVHVHRRNATPRDAPSASPVSARPALSNKGTPGSDPPRPCRPASNGLATATMAAPTPASAFIGAGAPRERLDLEARGAAVERRGAREREQVDRGCSAATPRARDEPPHEPAPTPRRRNAGRTNTEASRARPRRRPAPAGAAREPTFRRRRLATTTARTRKSGFIFSASIASRTRPMSAAVAARYATSRDEAYVRRSRRGDKTS